ncbi:RNA polymerase sigma factor [Dinghuibacter silviterrae]|uniref:RNA polymerase sigma-70 factor (ECF subfamily) n=1 Tax=Dinghuibacter silviterrae TaxID=1539049 RepID=A0A4R8DMW5_9BACT|nr:sigma-70 family RNA polymerase sigma factor [Dinghuibacter silviterrae]TDW99035.1 RNA polymerase sigma-70 factor (ECF subfamily) [Dinghuibacter silviterrae]
MEIEEHFFRHESGRIVAALTRLFGVGNLALAEDVTQDAFCRAMETWKLRGLPKNPSAWLMTVAKNRALDILRRKHTARAAEPELTRFLESEWTLVPTVEEAFSARAVKDSQLRMMFSCCHPRISEEAQIALILHILCGFNVMEIAQAFMSSHAAIEQRITRAKKILAESTTLFDLDDTEFPSRLSAVLQALYLLFNEGYHGSSPEAAVRMELCQEAILLINLLIEQPVLVTPRSYALAALMYLNAARLPARLDGSDNLVSFFEQDRSLWDHNLIAEGQALLDLSASGTELTRYHIEAAIAAMHTSAARSEDTDWKQIVSLYDMLMAIHPSPVIALNRAIAIAQLDGPEQGLREIGVIHDLHRLSSYPFYPAALGELEFRRGNYPVAKAHFSSALALARSTMERNFLQRRIDTCKKS